MTNVRFLDFHNACGASYVSGTVQDRVRELTDVYFGVYVVAIGGFPVLLREDRLTWCGGEVSTARVRAEFLAGLGLSAAPTFMNKSGKSIVELGELCAQREHTWAYRWMTLSLLFVGYGLQAELAFARDCNFAMSWPVTKMPTGDLFIASAHLSAWQWFTRHTGDVGFDSDARRAMRSAADVLAEILPEGT